MTLRLTIDPLAPTIRMKRILPVTLALTLAAVCCIVAIYFSHFYYTLYQQTHTELQVSMDGKIDSLRQEMRALPSKSTSSRFARTDGCRQRAGSRMKRLDMPQTH